MGDSVYEAGLTYRTLIEAYALRFGDVRLDTFRRGWKEDSIGIIIVAARSLYHPSIIEGH
jgi:hypothetical protein